MLTRLFSPASEIFDTAASELARCATVSRYLLDGSKRSSMATMPELRIRELGIVFTSSAGAGRQLPVCQNSGHARVLGRGDFLECFGSRDRNGWI